MSLNIKNDETLKLVQELAALTGESLTTAVKESVRERLIKIRAQTGNELAHRLVKIGLDCASRLKEPFRSGSHGELLYDERGLPK